MYQITYIKDSLKVTICTAIPRQFTGLIAEEEVGANNPAPKLAQLEKDQN